MSDNSANKKLNFIEKLISSPTFKNVKNKNKINNARKEAINKLNNELLNLTKNNADQSEIDKCRKKLFEIENDPYYIIDQKEIDEMLSHKKTYPNKKTSSTMVEQNVQSITLRLGASEKLKITQIQSLQSNTIDEYELILSSNKKNEPYIYKLEREIAHNDYTLKYTNYIYGKIDFNKLKPQPYINNAFSDNTAQIHDCEDYRATICNLLSKNNLEKLLLNNNGNFGTLTKNKYNAYIQTKLPNSSILDNYLKRKKHISYIKNNFTKVLAYEVGTIDILDKNNNKINSLEQYIIARDNSQNIKSDLVYAHINFKQLSQPNEVPNNYTNIVQNQLFSEENIKEKYLGSVSETALYVTKNYKLKDIIAPNKFQNLNFDTIDIP